MVFPTLSLIARPLRIAQRAASDASRLLGWLLMVGVLATGWAGSAAAQPSGGSWVDMPSQEASGQAITLRGMLWTPAVPPKGAVVVLHGGGGWSDFREGHYGRALSAAGFAVLAVDSFGSRRIGPGLDHYRVAFEQMARDGFAARRLLIERGFPAERIALMGSSKGGAGALYAADRHFLPQQQDRFPVALALYPVCHVRARSPQPVSRLWIGLGEKDDLTGTTQCEEIADAYGRAGGRVSVKTYRDAVHGFDGDPANTVLFYASQLESFTRCVVYVEADGQESFEGKTYPANGEAIMQAMRKSCVRKGASFWTNVRQKQALTQDIIEFLTASLGT